MDLKYMLKILKKRCWIIVCIILASLSTACLLTFYYMDDIYTASTTLIVGRQTETAGIHIIEYDDILVNQKLVKTYSLIVKSDRVLEQVISDLKLNLSIDDLRDLISITSEKDTEIISISVENTNPQQAQVIANSLAQVFKKQVNEIMQLDNVYVLDRARLPDEAASPQPVINILAALIIGILLGLGTVFLIEYLDNTVKEADDLERQLNLVVLGVIPEFERQAK